MANEQKNETKTVEITTSEDALLGLMQKTATLLQPLNAGERRRVLSSVATMLGIATGEPRRTQPQPQQRGR